MFELQYLKKIVTETYSYIQRICGTFFLLSTQSATPIVCDDYKNTPKKGFFYC